MRASSLDQHPESQLHDLRQRAAQRGVQVMQIPIASPASKPDARASISCCARRAAEGFAAALLWAPDRMARSAKISSRCGTN